HAENGDVRVLFSGDSEAETESRLLEAPNELHADVLKVAHHGSRYASSDRLLSAASPKWGIISCGKNNDYGHPHKESVQRLVAHGVKLARTDLNGDIVVTSDNKGISVSTERSASAEELAAPGQGHPRGSHAPPADPAEDSN